MIQLSSVFTAIATFYFFMGGFVHAQSLLTSESTFVLPPKDYRFLVEDKKNWNGKHEFSLKNQSFSKPYKTKVSGLRMSVGYKVKLGNKISGRSEYPFTAIVTDPQIIIGRVETSDVIYERRGNVKIKINVRASCQNVVVKSNASRIDMKGKIRLYASGGVIRLKLASFELKQSSKDWSINTGSCGGIKGYDQEIAKYIGNNLATQRSIEDAVRSMVNTELQSQADDINKSLLSRVPIDVDKNIGAEFVPRFAEMTNSGNVLINGDLDMVFKRAKTKGKIYQHLNISKSFLDSRKDSQLILPKKFMQRLVDATYTNGFWFKEFQTSKTKDLQALLSNRMGLFFLWPDLLNFDERANFKIDMFPTRGPSLLYLKQNKEGASMVLRGGLGVDMRAPKEGQHIPYVSFHSKTSRIPMYMDITQKGLVLSFAEPQVKFTKKWASSYISKYNPNQHIDLEFLTKQLKKTIAQQQATFQIGELNLNGKKKLKASRIEVGGVTFRILFNERGARLNSPPRRYNYVPAGNNNGDSNDFDPFGVGY